MRTIHLLLPLLIAAAAPEIRSEENPAGGSVTEPEERGLKLHEMEAKAFRELPEAAANIDFENIDHHLLAAAVFHETNVRRLENDLPALDYKPGLREAARIQARGMRKEEMISHQHPDESKKTLGDRLEFLGIKGSFYAENVAMTFGIQYESGEPMFPREQEGRKIFSKEAGGPAIPPHTYLSFATTLLDQWMNSPGHRKNILAPEAKLHGASSLHDRSADGMDRFYSAQVFFAPF